MPADQDAKMAWIESHQELARHPKVSRLARILKINKAQAIGHLHLLWWWTLDFSPTGDLSAFTSCELGSAAEWQSDGDQFKKALIDTGLMDADGRIHDWHEYAGKLVDRRTKDRERKRVQRMSDGSPPLQYPTQPNPTLAGDVARATLAERPAWPEVAAYAQHIGLAEWKARDWFEEMESCGWLDYQRRAVIRWQPMLTRVCRKWEADGRPMHPPSSNGKAPRPLSPLDLKTVLAAKQLRADGLKAKHCQEGPTGNSWDHNAPFEEWRKLRKEIRGLTERLSEMA